ncbi:hypothetical protein ABXN37_26700 [Piscinibacter sakaiensis]|uniref:hypothetical protein n=1 Tax=Piscinibacter sakaiensis TaxID=1547922 RepID=UPI0037278F83
MRGDSVEPTQPRPGMRSASCPSGPTRFARLVCSGARALIQASASGWSGSRTTCARAAASSRISWRSRCASKRPAMFSSTVCVARSTSIVMAAGQGSGRGGKGALEC